MKYAVPQSVVPGATRALDPDTKIPLFDHKGRPVWNMPNPYKMVTHQGVVKVGKKFVRQEIQVPVYRSLSAKDARFIRAQIRRNNRKAKENNDGE